MRSVLVMALCVATTGCMIQKVGPPGVVLTRPIKVAARDVRVYQSAADIRAPHAVVEEVWIKDDGDLMPREMESRLRIQAGARGANAIVLHRLNRRDNGTRIDLKPQLDNPFDYFRATAVWIGAGARPERYLGTLGGVRRQP